MKKINSESQTIALKIKQGKSIEKSIKLDVLAEVDRLLSAHIDNSRMKSFVIIYGIEGKSAMVTYPLISKTRLQITSEDLLKENNFTLILHQPTVIGNVLPSTLKSRFFEEKITLLYAFIIFISTLSLLAFFTYPASINYAIYLSDPGSQPIIENVIHFYEVIGQSLLTIMTLFLTVFVLFTISQNSDISKDINLYTQGLFYKYIRDDLYITRISSISLLTSALGLLFTSMPSEIYVFTFHGIEINKMNSLIPLLYSISIGAFIISLTSLNYYSGRVIVVNESNLMKQILDEREMIAKPLRQQLDHKEQEFNDIPSNIN